jgi:hypothetical protein
VTVYLRQAPCGTQIARTFTTLVPTINAWLPSVIVIKVHGVRALAVLILVIACPIVSSQESQATAGQLWSWFGKCRQESDMGLEVALTGKVIYRTSFSVCPIRARSEEARKTLVFSFKGGHVFQGEYHTTRAETIEGNIWQAGSDPGFILLGVSFSTGKQSVLNTIHIAKPGKASFTEIDRGLTVRTFPIRRKHSE